MRKERPQPEKILKRIQEEERQQKRGKLKIYLGAAPGVGKTYAMLQDCLMKRAQKLNVVAGIIETHGRSEIEEKLKSIEILPKQQIEYHGKQLLEFDLDSALKLRPDLILIDEMAHTNAPGLRHTKRWQDIKELLDCGINVYTTLNVQHIESLSDDASQIIHAPINETIPDFMLEMADTIELVDLPPEELLKRLEEGKVYIPTQAKLAFERYFRKGNLIALRELALRITADRVGAQVLSYRQGQDIQHIWPTKEKILVCIGPGKESVNLIRTAKRMATGLHAKWIAVYVDTAKFQSSEKKRNAVIQNLRLAEQLGAEIRILTGFDIVKEILHFAREQNITQIMIWKQIRTRFRDLFSRNYADEMVRHSAEIDVYIMTGTRDETTINHPAPIQHSIPWKIYGVSTGIILLATGIDFLLYPFLHVSNLMMVYIMAITIIALYGRIGVSIIASLASVLLYGFFFAPSFNQISDFQYILTLLVMLLVSQVISHLTIMTCRQKEIARRLEHQSSLLYSLSHQLAVSRGVDNLLIRGISYIAEIFDSDVIALLPKKGQLATYARYGTEQALSLKEQSVAQWSYDLNQSAGSGTDTQSSSGALYVPLIASQGTLGVLRIRHSKADYQFSPDQIHLLESCANQIALALEVDRLQETTTR